MTEETPTEWIDRMKLMMCEAVDVFARRCNTWDCRIHATREGYSEFEMSGTITPIDKDKDAITPGLKMEVGNE